MKFQSHGDIKPGQRYVGTGPTLFGTPSRDIWRVREVRRANDGLLYADLHSEREPGRKKMVSTAALADTNFYRPL